MRQLEALVRDAAALAAGASPLSATEAEVGRQMQICNACRYCEGFCAVFPAMTRRLDFGKADIHYLANLCHNCGACLHACQYAPPHEFAVNVPQAMAAVRGQTYADYAWPSALGALYQRNGLALALASAGGLALFLVMLLLAKGSLLTAPLAGNFYAVFPHNTLVAMFGAVFAFAVVALAVGVRKFWREVSPGHPTSAAAAEAAGSALRLEYLDGGHGQGCNESDDAFTPWRRRFHHATFYGFMLCFAATSVATLYHYLLGREAPYPIYDLPVLLGTAGGVGLLIGPAGLLVAKFRREPDMLDEKRLGMDVAFLAMLFLTSLTGLALLAFRETAAMGMLLAIHLGVVFALFFTMPYGKFVHGLYRFLALVRYAREQHGAYGS
jgi:citrate/tricarballylate utilization protein